MSATVNNTHNDHSVDRVPPKHRQRSLTPPVGCLDALKQMTCSLSCGGTTCSIHETSDLTDSPSPPYERMRLDPAEDSPSKTAASAAKSTRKRKISTKTSSSSSPEGGKPEGRKEKKATTRRKRVKLVTAATAANAPLDSAAASQAP